MVKWTGLFDGVTSQTLDHNLTPSLHASPAHATPQPFLCLCNSLCLALAGSLSLRPLHVCNSTAPLVTFKKSFDSRPHSVRIFATPRHTAELLLDTILDPTARLAPRRPFMASQNRSTRFVCLTNSSPSPASVTFPSIPTRDIKTQPTQPRELSFFTTASHSTSFTGCRCSERGCVFPASSSQSGKCLYHERQLEEPSLFCSQQPSRLLLDPSRSMPDNEEYDQSRKRDRLRLAKEWEEFQRDSGI
jgi:hypothetical protein